MPTVHYHNETVLTQVYHEPQTALPFTLAPGESRDIVVPDEPYFPFLLANGAQELKEDLAVAPGKTIDGKDVSSIGGSAPCPAVIMKHGAWGAGWTVWKPDGTQLDTTGTTTQGLQEAITYAWENGYKLEVYGASVLPPGKGGFPVSRITCSTPLAIPTAQGNSYHFYGVDLYYTGDPAQSCIVFDSFDFMEFVFRGQIIYPGNQSAVRLHPENDNGETFIGGTSSIIDISVIAIVNPGTLLPERTHGIGFQIQPTHGLIVNNQIRIGEVNGGLCGLQVDNPVNPYTFEANHIFCMSHTQGGSVTVNVGQGSNTLIFGNVWDLILNGAQQPVTNVLSVWGQDDIYRVSITGGTNGILLNASADRNKFLVGKNTASTPVVDNSTSGNNPGSQGMTSMKGLRIQAQAARAGGAVSSNAFTTLTCASIADDATISLESYISGNHGLLDIVVLGGGGTAAAGTVLIQSGFQAVTIVNNPNTWIATTDTDAKICVFSDGDGTYSIKNRLGAEYKFMLFYRGFGGNSI